MNQKSSNAEKLFWLTILILLLVYITLQILAYKNIKIPDHNTTQDTIVPQKITTVVKEFIVDDESIKQKLEDNNTLYAIDSSLRQKLNDLNNTIDESVDKLFSPVYQRIDLFLDFHYSVIGEYSELGSAVAGKIEETIAQKLFGPNFYEDLKESTRYINQNFIESLDRQQKVVESHATHDIDRELNSNILSILKKDIQSSISIQQNKILTILGIGVSYKVIVGVLSTKIAAKLSSKLVIKGAIKASSKIGAAGGGLVAGAVCGPGAIICSPVFALAAWFGSDALLISGDEYLHRDEFKQEIIRSIDEQKRSLKKQYKRVYSQEFTRQADDMIKKYKSMPIKKRERRRVRERMEE